MLGSFDFLDNEVIGERDHALHLTRLVEELDLGGRLLFDEYALGLWDPDSAGGLALSKGVRGVSLHLLLLLLLVVWRAAWTREFPRDPQPLERVSPLARAEARAALLERAGRPDLAGDLLRRGVLNRLRARLKLAGSRRERAFDCSLDALVASDQTAGGRWEAFADREARRMAQRSGRPEAGESWSRVFTAGLPRTARGLEELADRLSRVEREALKPTESWKT